MFCIVGHNGFQPKSVWHLGFLTLQAHTLAQRDQRLVNPQGRVAQDNKSKTTDRIPSPLMGEESKVRVKQAIPFNVSFRAERGIYAAGHDATSLRTSPRESERVYQSSWRNRGSKRSRSQSPKKFKDIVSKNMARPGKNEDHHTPLIMKS